MTQHNDHTKDYLEQLISENQASTFLGYSPRSLQKWRCDGSGPRFVKVSGRSVRYRRKDLIQWAEENIVFNAKEAL
jgi:predicted DNA-binding transcriptional regulator AlpA